MDGDVGESSRFFLRSPRRVEPAEPTRVIDSAERLSESLEERSPRTVEPAEPTRVIDSAERLSDPLEHRLEEGVETAEPAAGVN